MKSFCLIVLVLIVSVGCDQGKKMVAPVVDDIPGPVAEDPAPEVSDEPMPGEPLINFDISDVDIPEPTPKTIPEGVEIFGSDTISHITTEGYQENHKLLGDGEYGPYIFQTATEAGASEEVSAFMDVFKQQVVNYCTGKWIEGATLVIDFTSRAERGKFMEALPGGWSPLESDVFWWYGIDEYVIIVDEKDVYFRLIAYPNWEATCKGLPE